MDGRILQIYALVIMIRLIFGITISFIFSILLEIDSVYELESVFDPSAIYVLACRGGTPSATPHLQ